MNVKLIAITHYLDGEGTPEELIEHAGRVCYRSESHGNPGPFIRARLRDGHESIVEHASATFEISGISRACSHQLVRHRLASYSQESQRYVDMSGQPLVVPNAIADNPAAIAIWEQATNNIEAAYLQLRNSGVKKEDARAILPVATSTTIVVTMNFRELLHFFRMRISPQAQQEIKDMANEMLQLVRPHAPSVFGGEGT